MDNRDNTPDITHNCSRFPCIQSPTTEVSGRRDAAEHRNRILTVARTLFAEQGVANVSMHQIARAANIGQGTLYRNFAHKGLLCIVLLQENAERFQHQILTYLHQPSPDLSALERLRYFLRQATIIVKENDELLTTIMEASCHDPQDLSFTAPFPDWIRRIIEILLRDAVERQEIAPLDIEYTSYVIQAQLTLTLNLNRYLHNQPGYDEERTTAGLEHILFHGLRP